LSEEVSKKFLQTYLEMLDFSHLFFTQEDVNAVTAKYGDAMAGDILMGTLRPAYEIYALYTKRVDERVAKIKELLKQPSDFKSNATVELSRQKSPWPKNEAEANELWGPDRKRTASRASERAPDRARAAARLSPL